MRILISGSSGFIGSNMVRKFKELGHEVVGLDIESPLHVTPNRFCLLDLSVSSISLTDEVGLNTFDEVYILACCMGGMGFIGDEEKHGYEIGIGSTKIITKMIDYCRGTLNSKQKVFYSSSACVYPEFLQEDPNATSLRERDAIPAAPDLLYGWQKLYAEKMFQASGLNYRIARFHNIFGRFGCFDTGKEKAPAALMRKVIMAKDGDEIEVWGSGQQTRSFLHIDTCLEGVERLMQSTYMKPLNIGSDECVSINELAQMIIGISGKKLTIKNVPGNVGVQGRNSDNTLCREVLGWSPNTKLIDGLKKTYSWIESQINKQ